ncbi:MAG TPA: hypothetical protein VGM78_06270, partial [Ilumatobacteraceae bacterium]
MLAPVRPFVIAAVALCLVLNVIELLRSGFDATHWGVLADLSELIGPLLAAVLLGRRALDTEEVGWWWLAG